MFVDRQDVEAFVQQLEAQRDRPPNHLRWLQASIHNFFRFQKQQGYSVAGLTWVDEEAVEAFREHLETEALWSKNLIRFQAETLAQFMTWVRAHRQQQLNS